ncbi:ABC transporter permease [Salinisphaera sp. Q1T1-3]|uniref:ABC transporter permease n=1 Tax=Salinisphaera sp. Q1T1-3 TaxID=2321229 RepID=UPI000E766AD7|nr:FtsX-like permease family protein [Salinisphaera sp. Q1T1-3]RJS93478.1 FtsX-like permease family protein [Salinisphaera sp. Q1T1-3]
MPNPARPGLRLAARDARRALTGPGAARLLVAALIVAVAAVTAVTRLTDRVDAAVVAQAATTLGADLVLASDAPPSSAQTRLLAGSNLDTATRVQMNTALAAGDRLLRVSLSAVSPHYPLAGAITLERDGRTIDVDHGPARGTVWIAPAAAARLNVGLGDRLAVGDTTLTVAALVTASPGGGSALFDTAPSVLMATADLAPTGLTGPGARLDHDTLIGGPPTAIAAVRAQLAPTLAPGERLVDPRSANRGLAAAMDKAAVFLNLAALAAVVLAGVAIALCATRHAAAQRDAIALYKTLGAARGVLRRLLATQLALLGAVGLVAGWLLGETVAYGLIRVIDTLFTIALPAGHWWASWPAIGTAVVLIAGFAWPAQRTALATPPARVLARSNDPGTTRRWPIHGAAIASVAVMAAAATGDIALTGWVLAGLAGAAAAFALIAWALLAILARLRQRLDVRLPGALRLGLDGVLRRRATVMVQCVAVALGLTVLFVLVVVRGDLLAGWQTRIAQDAPNRFVINVNTDQRGGIADLLHEHGINTPTFYPIVRARLTAVNGQTLDRDAALRKQAGRLAERALNLSWTNQLKADNRIVAGHWWAEHQTAADHGPIKTSIAESVARRLDIGVGDRLAFDVAGQALTLEITSIRSIDWSSLQPNFFVLVPPGGLDGYPVRWITSFYLPPGKEAALAALVRAYPNLNVIDITALLARVQTLVDRVTLAVELVFGFTLAAGLVVLAAAMGVHRETRRREAAVLRALGATSARLRRAAWSECLVIGAITAGSAALAARLAAGLIAHYALHVDYASRLGVWLLAVVIAVGLIAAAGVAALGDVRRQPAWQALRGGS